VVEKRKPRLKWWRDEEKTNKINVVEKQ